MSEVHLTRSCRGCSACCTVLGVHEEPVKKTPFERCKFLSGSYKACSIYDKRPKQCANFQCAWLQGVGSVSDRPDLSGVLLATEVTGHAHSILIWEVFKGAFETGRGMRIIRAMVEFAKSGRVKETPDGLCAVILARKGKRCVMFTPPRFMSILPAPLGTWFEYAEQLPDQAWIEANAEPAGG